jgi:hypothetical protein
MRRRLLLLRQHWKVLLLLRLRLRLLPLLSLR